jgi:glycosyltransferase involved in cell wall biosynthesis
VVSDGSTDATDTIVQRRSSDLAFLRLIRLERRDGRNFASKVKAVWAGFQSIRELNYGYIGNLDADVSVGPDYFESLIGRFSANASLGIAGGWVREDAGRGFESRPHNSVRDVPHAAQLMRRECYAAIGDYVPFLFGGEDTCASVKARMHGWEVEAFRDLPVDHYRRTGTAIGSLRSAFRSGRAEYSLGYHPLFHLMKALARSIDKPYVVASALRLLGYVYASARRQERPVSVNFVKFLRSEQMRRIASWPAPPSVCHRLVSMVKGRGPREKASDRLY